MKELDEYFRKQSPVKLLRFAIIFTVLTIIAHYDLIQPFLTNDIPKSVIMTESIPIETIKVQKYSFRQAFNDMGILFGILGGVSGITSCVLQILQILHKKESK